MAKFQKGVSGNPGGRPKVPSDLREAARAYTQEALETLVAILRSPKSPTAARVQAASLILDRGYGRPAQALDVSVNCKSPDEMTDAELLAVAAGGDDEDDAPATKSQRH